MSRAALIGDVQRQSDGMTLAAASSPSTIRQALPIFLRHGSPLILVIAAVVVFSVRWHLGAWSYLDLVPAVILVALWPIQEWLIHVFILHFRPFRLAGWTFDFRVPRKHREHHREPWNYEILFIPMHSYLYSLPLLVLLWIGLAPSPQLAWTGIGVHMLLALHYEWVHFLIHTRVQPRTQYYRRLWRNHRLHHFKNEHYWFGVTRLEADGVLRTAPAGNEVPLSSTCRELNATPISLS
jgi:hypothetical protein